METGLIALDDIADTIICEVSYLSLTEDASANQTSQGYIYLSRQMELGSVIFGGRQYQSFLLQFRSALQVLQDWHRP